MVFKQLLLGAILPGSIAVVMMLAVWQPWRKRGEQLSLLTRILGGALAMAYGFAASFVAVNGTVKLPPQDAVEWVVYAALAAGILGLIESAAKLPAAATWILRLVLAASMLWLTLKSRINPELAEYGFWASPSQAFAWVAGIAAILLLSWAVTDKLQKTKLGGLHPALFMVLATGSSIVLLNSGNLKLAQAAGMIAAVTGAALFVAILGADFTKLRGFSVVPLMVYTLLVVNGYFYAELPLIAGILLLAAPLLASIILLPQSAKQSAATKYTCAIAASVIPLALSFLLVSGYIPDPGAAPDTGSEAGDEYDYYDNY